MTESLFGFTERGFNCRLMEPGERKNTFAYTLHEIYDLCVEMKTQCKFCPIENDCIDLFNVAPIRWRNEIERLSEEAKE